MKHEHATNSALHDVSLLEYDRFDDQRGSLSPLIASSNFDSIHNFRDFEIKQINSVKSNFSVIRGIHSSSHLWPQRKIIFCIEGQITDVIVDLCPHSETFGATKRFELSGESNFFLTLPACVGHSFQTLSDYSIVNYLLDNEYNPHFEININPISNSLKIDWTEPYVLSSKDESSVYFEDFGKNLT
jgi:dTDP-4-dehydrorhamnose 3,5-epimerase